MARKILGIAGSLRRDSYNKAVLRTLAEQSWEGIEIEIFDISSIPLYNSDQDGEHPPDPVQKLKNSVAACAGVLIVSPEYNYGIPGVLKNALDWASRPAYKSNLVGKPVGIITCSIATTGGVRAQAAIRDCFYGCLAEVVPHMEVAIPTVQDKVQGGRLTDEKSLAMASGLVKALAAATSRKELGGRAADVMSTPTMIGPRAGVRYPQPQKAASFNVDEVLEKLKESSGK